MEEMKKLVELLNKHSYNYYVLDNPTISDKEYDALYDKLVFLEKQTGIVLEDSPSKRVGDDVLSSFNKVTHKTKLLSLAKCQSKDELLEWINATKKQEPKSVFSLEYKFDGLTIACTYKNGYFVSAATRGNGMVGEDVTLQVKTIKSVPMKIDFLGELIVQGEGMITLSNLKKYNKDYPNEQLKNARNAVSGAIRNLDPKQTAKRNLDWFCYNICYAEDMTFSTQEQMRDFLKKNGFKVSEYFYVSDDGNCILEQIDIIDKTKKDLNILIDGMVLKLNQVDLRDEFGYTSKFPKWAMAYKFEAQEVTSELKNIIWQVGRTGKITPIAEVEPVELAGATVTRATLNNYGDILRKKIEIGSSVFIRRSNEVIPEILGLAESYENAKQIEKPKSCPSCGAELVTIGANLFCPNSSFCKAQIVDKLTHYASRDAMNIEQLSEQTILLLFNNLKVNSFSKLYDVTYEQLLNLEGFKQKKSQNIIDSINKSKKVEFSNFIFALGISGVGKKTAKDLANTYVDLDDLTGTSKERLVQIRDIGVIIAESIYDYFHNEQNIQEINELLGKGVKIHYSLSKKSDIFDGLTFVLTGTLNTFTRNEATDLVESHGGQTSSSVSKNTNYVVAGENAGSKLAKAQSLGVKVLTEEEFIKMLKN